MGGVQRTHTIQEVIYNKHFKNTYVCQRCKTKLKAQAKDVLKGKAKCRKCGYKGLRKKSHSKIIPINISKII